MSNWSRWQDWATVLLGIALGVMPFVTQTTGESTATWTAFIMGTLIAIAGLFAAATEKPSGLELFPVIFGIVLFVAPWALQYTQVVAISWTSWIVGFAVVMLSGYELLGTQSEPAAI